MRVDLTAAASRERAAEEAAVVAEDGAPAVPELPRKTGRALDVGGEKRDGPGGKRLSHRSPRRVHSAVSPSQQPSLKRQRGHCHVCCRHSIRAPQRRQRSSSWVRMARCYAAALAEHRRLLREAFSRHGGVEVDTQGDAFFYAFARASDAVHAAEEDNVRSTAARGACGWASTTASRR